MPLAALRPRGPTPRGPAPRGPGVLDDRCRARSCKWRKSSRTFSGVECPRDRARFSVPDYGQLDIWGPRIGGWGLILAFWGRTRDRRHGDGPTIGEPLVGVDRLGSR